MNTKLSRQLPLVASILFWGTFTCFAQDFQALKVSNNKSKSPEKETVTGYAYNPEMPALFTGFAIELTSSELPLKKNYPAFQNFGKVYYDKTRTGYYSYLILTDFQNEESLKEYLVNVVNHRIKGAKIIKYKNGQRKVSKPKRVYRMID